MASSETATPSVPKVIVHLKATGDAPILKQAKFKISAGDKFATVIDFLRRQLNRETLFVYVNSSFSPSPDESVIDLYNAPHLMRDTEIVNWIMTGYGEGHRAAEDQCSMVPFRSAKSV